jgi:hypothetical protein
MADMPQNKNLLKSALTTNDVSVDRKLISKGKKKSET